MSNVARALIVGLRYSFMRRKNREMNKYVEGFLYYLMKSVTWLDETILFKYLRREEYQANKNACLISNGESLFKFDTVSLENKDCSFLISPKVRLSISITYPLV